MLAGECLNVIGGVATVLRINFPISAGNLIVRLAVSPEEIAPAQSLRYRVFYEEMDANRSLENKLVRFDSDRFDEICDHLLVICEDRDNLPCGAVGTYKNLRQRTAI